MKRLLDKYATAFLIGYFVIADCRGADNWTPERKLQWRTVRDMQDFSFALIAASRPDVHGNTSRWIVGEDKTGSHRTENREPSFTGYYAEGTLDVKFGIDRKFVEPAIKYKVYVQTVNFRENGQIARLGFPRGLICEVDPQKDGSSKIVRIYLLPTDWIGYVKAAWEYYISNEALFDPSNAKDNLSKLDVLVRHENPLIAIASFRALLYGQAVNAQWVRRAIFSAKGIRREVFEKLADSSVYKW